MNLSNLTMVNTVANPNIMEGYIKISDMEKAISLQNFVNNNIINQILSRINIAIIINTVIIILFVILLRKYMKKNNITLDIPLIILLNTILMITNALNVFNLMYYIMMKQSLMYHYLIFWFISFIVIMYNFIMLGTPIGNYIEFMLKSRIDKK